MNYKVRNRAQYDAKFRRCASLSLRGRDAAIAGWHAAPRPSAGGPARYSDLAITTGLMLSLAFHLPLRQSEAVMAAVLKMLGVSLAIAEHSTLSRRAMAMACQRGAERGRPSF